jgi:Asp-tRNA(Asn)/Glu-tRNA(Gln) amidotransferase B subunit
MYRSQVSSSVLKWNRKRTRVSRHYGTSTAVVAAATTTNETKTSSSIHTNSSNNTTKANFIRSNWYVDPITGHITNTTVSVSHQQPIYQVIVGLEIHVQLNHCSTKLFSPAKQHQPHASSSSSSSSFPPNTVPAIHPYDLAVPGILPVLSVSAVRYAILLAGMVNCTQIPSTSRFERKHYTYSDLPHSYQLTQQRYPIAQKGLIKCDLLISSRHDKHHRNSKTVKSVPQQTSTSSSSSSSKPQETIQCRINRIQLEQDTGKSTSITTSSKISAPSVPSNSSRTSNLSSSDTLYPLPSPSTTSTTNLMRTVTYTRIDMNRAGIPLCEIVTEPDLRSACEATSMVQWIRHTLQQSHISSAHMQHGQLRVDCNVNIVPVATLDNKDHDQQSTRRKHPRVEVKNLNSIQQIEDSIQYEAYRQLQILEDDEIQNRDESVTNIMSRVPFREETRTYNTITKRTELLRYKDQQQDYRFLPEPDLPPCVINQTVLQDCTTIAEYIQKYTPPSSTVRVQQFVQIGVASDQAKVIVHNHPNMIQYFCTAVQCAMTEANDSNYHPYNIINNNKIEANDDTTMTSPRSLQEMASQPSPQLQRAAVQVANLLCNVLFHLVKEQYRTSLLQQQQQQIINDNAVAEDDHDDEYDSTLLNIDELTVTSQQLGEIVQMIQNEEISYTMAKQLIHIIHGESTNTSTSTNGIRSPRRIALKRNIKLITDLAMLRNLCTDVIANHPDEMAVYQKGGKYKIKMEKLFLGKVMNLTNGNAHPERLRDVVIECLALQQLCPPVQ